MTDTRSIVLVAAVLLAPALGLSAAMAQDRTLIGYLEEVQVYPDAVSFKAKIDTGAKTSSIDARDVVAFKKDGEDWVRFTVINRNGESIALERRVARVSNVRRQGTETQVRYVVRLGVCLGGFYKDAEVNLADRKGMNYRMLIGRIFLGDRFIIDSNAKYLTTPDCPEATGQ